MTKIFISIPWFHPAYKAGGPVQSIANLVNEFNEGIEYYIFCGNTDLNNSPLENIQTGEWTSYNPHTRVWYAANEKRSETLVNLIEKIKPDIVFIIGIFSWHFNMVPLLFSKAERKIISVRGMLFHGALSQKKTKKKLFLSLWKFFNWHKKASFHVTNEEEKKAVLKCFKDANIFIAGNFPRKFIQSRLIKKQGHLKIITIALISPMKNHLLILEALEQCPAIIEYHICGPVKDMEYWQQCLEQLKQLPVNISVEYHGEITPEKIPAMLELAHVFIMPSKSENFGHALYEALSSGKPLITSHYTPWQNLKQNKAGINVDPDVSQISDALLFFAAMPQNEYDEWNDGAAGYAKNKFNINTVKEEYSHLFSLEQ